MVSQKRCMYAPLFIILLLLLAGCIDTVTQYAAPPKEAEENITLLAGFSQEDGSPLGGNTVRLSSKAGEMNYPLDEGGEVRITGLPKWGELLLSVFDKQGQAVGAITLFFDQGAVIDAITSGDGAGYITLREETDVVALSFSLLGDGSLHCSLRLASSK